MSCKRRLHNEEAKVSDHVDVRITKPHPQKFQSKIPPCPNKREMRLIESDWAIRELGRLLGKARALLCQVIFHALLVSSEEMIYCRVSQPEGIAACSSDGTNSQFSGKWSDPSNERGYRSSCVSPHNKEEAFNQSHS